MANTDRKDWQEIGKKVVIYGFFGAIGLPIVIPLLYFFVAIPAYSVFFGSLGYYVGNTMSVTDRAIDDAVKQNKPELCDKIKMVHSFIVPEPNGPDERNRCYDQVAIQLNDPEACNSNSCILNFADEKEDISICDMVTSAEYKSDCYTHFIGRGTQKSDCYKVEEGIHRDECLYVYSWKHGDFLICEYEILDIDLKDWCYKTQAILTKSTKACEKIKNEIRKDNCKLELKK